GIGHEGHEKPNDDQYPGTGNDATCEAVHGMNLKARYRLAQPVAYHQPGEETERTKSDEDNAHGDQGAPGGSAGQTISDPRQRFGAGDQPDGETQPRGGPGHKTNLPAPDKRDDQGRQDSQVEQVGHGAT